MSKMDKLKEARKKFDTPPISDTILDESTQVDFDRQRLEGTKRLKNAREINIDKIKPDENQPRKNFDEDALEELSESIKKHGLLQPVTLRPMPQGQFQLVAGERRLRATEKIGLQEIQAVILTEDQCKKIDTGKTSVEELAVIENLHRRDLTPLEEAKCYRAMLTMELL